jgi:hypothetical protein
MNSKVGLAVVIALALAGCGPKPPRLASPGHHGEGPAGEQAGGPNFSDNISANSFFGGNNITVLAHACAGRVRLEQGAALINDACFTGDTNVVICSDASAPNAVMCAARKGALAIGGAGHDEISYARVR